MLKLSHISDFVQHLFRGQITSSKLTIHPPDAVVTFRGLLGGFSSGYLRFSGTAERQTTP